MTATNGTGMGPASSPVTVMPGFVPNAPTNVIAGRTGFVTTTAGSGAAGFADGTGSAAQFNGPSGMGTDSAGNVYVADASNNRIRKITPAGVVTTFAGSGAVGSANGTGTAATFNNPEGVDVDSSGNVYVADTGNNLIRKITSAGVVTTLAGSGTAGYANGTGTAAQFNAPANVAVDSSGNVYVGDTGNNRVRKITSAGVVSLLAGSGAAGYADGTGSSAVFNGPTGVDVDSSGNVYVADGNNNRIRKITSAGVVTTLAGSGGNADVDGPDASAQFAGPSNVSVDNSGNVYVTTWGGDDLRMISTTGYVSTVAGSGSGGYADGTGNGASFNNPAGVHVDAFGNVYVSDYTNERVRKVIAAMGDAQVSWTAPSANGGQAPQSYTVTSSPGGITCTVTTTVCTVTGLTNGTAYTFTVTATNGTGTSAASSASNSFTPMSGPGAPTSVNATPGNTTAAVTWTAPSSNGGSAITGYTATASSGQSCATTSTGCTITGLTNNVSITISVTASNAIGMGPASSSVSVMPGFVPNAPTTVVAGRAGVVGTLAGSSAGFVNGTGTNAQFNNPNNIAVDSSGNVYVADQLNNVIRKITPAGVVTTFAGNGTAGYVNGTSSSAEFNQPQGVAVDSSGNVYVGDTNNNDIRKITSSGTVSLFAGSSSQASGSTDGSSATFNQPNGIAVDSLGNVYVADTEQQQDPQDHLGRHHEHVGRFRHGRVCRRHRDRGQVQRAAGPHRRLVGQRLRR